MRKLSEDQEMTRILIGVTGGSGGGKTTLCENIKKFMAIDGNFKVAIIALDSFYKSVDKEKHKISEYNFDKPQALDFDMAFRVLSDLMRGQKAQIPKYCFTTHQRLKEVEEVEPTEIIMFEGIMALYDPRIRNLMKYKIFIHCDDDIRLCRRIKRDVKERGRTVENVLHQYYKFVKDAYRDFVYPTIRYADLIVPGNRNNNVSVDFIVRHMKNMTREIQFYKKALNTKTYFFGEILESFLRGEASDDTLNTETFNMQFLFPCTEQHKKELDLFIGQLLNEQFTPNYFKNIYINQFVRLLCELLQSVVNTLLKKKFDCVSILRSEDSEDAVLKDVENKAVRVLFIPYLTSENYEKVTTIRDKLTQENSHLVVLNIFCYHMVLKRLAKLKNCTVVNLFCIANEGRFKEVFQANLRDEHHQDSLIYSPKLIRKAEKAIEQFVEGQINGEDD